MPQSSVAAFTMTTSHRLPGPATAAHHQAQARFWDRMARRYAAARIADPAGYQTTLRRVAALLSPEQSVLEIGCGTGTTALQLAGGTRRMLATDVSPAMIAIARDKLAALPVPQLRFGLAGADDAAAGAVHDTVLAFNLLHLLPDLDTALPAILAALKPGGRFISKTPCLREMHPAVPRLLVPLLRAVGLAPPVLVFDAAQLQASLVRQGLEIEAVERHGSGRKDMRVFIVARKPL
jgi:SAM-dependent methyltransferase